MTQQQQAQLTQFFQATTKPEYFQVPITAKAAAFLTAQSPSTVEKLIKSPCVTYCDGVGALISVKKLNGLTVSESIQYQVSQSVGAIQAYNEVTAFLLQEGYSEAEIPDVVFNPVEHPNLAEEIRPKAVYVYQQGLLMQDTVTASVTNFINGRISSEWQHEDTAFLPKHLFDQFKLMMDSENSGGEIEPEAFEEKKITIITIA